MKKRKKILLIFFLMLLNNVFFCHPHLFIKPSIKVLTDYKIVKGIQFSWEWDKWWSQDVLESCDKDKNGKFDSKELNLVYKDFFIGIKDFDYFTIIFINSKKIIIKNILNFHAEINNNIVTYCFFILLDIQEKNKINFKIIFNDETIYTAFDDKIEILDINNENYLNCKISRYSYYGTQIIFDYIL